MQPGHSADVEELFTADRRRLSLGFTLGLVVGLIWLYPVSGVPGHDFMAEYAESYWRFGRSASLLLLLVLVNFKVALARLLSPRYAVIHFILFILPWLSLSVVPDFSFIKYACMPIWIGSVSLLILLSIKRTTRNAVLFGASVAALGFVIWGLSRYGLETGSFYGRARSHLGFRHPIFSASAVIAASFALYRICKFFVPHLVILRYLLHSLNYAGSLTLLIIADSRNSLLGYCLFLFAVFITKFAKRHSWLRSSLALSVMVFFFSYMLFSVFSSPEGDIYEALNRLSSLRIGQNQEFFSRFGDEFLITSLWGETPNLPTKSIVERKTFVSLDSIFITLLSNFGLIFSVLFYFWYMLRGISLFKTGNPSAVAAWITFLFFTIFDAQGFTPANILVFYLFFLVYRYPKNSMIQFGRTSSFRTAYDV